MTFLVEQLLLSEMTFGFELEAYVNKKSIPLRDSTRKWENDLNLIPTDEIYFYINKPQLYKNLQKYFSEYFGQSISVVADSSLSNIGSFELKSPVFNLTPLNIQECIKFLINLKNTPFKIKTDSSCGFHTHISFPSITPNDIYWIECNLALDENMQNNLSSLLLTNGVKVNFINKKYADNNYLKLLNKAILNNSYETIASLLSDDKYRIIRNHPQGTLEWRGPRNFLKTNEITDIKNFFIKLYKFAKWISNTLKNNEINGIDKNTFLSLVNDFKPTYNYDFKKDKKNNKILSSIIKNPLSLLKMDFTTQEFIDILDILNKTLGNKSLSFFKQYEKYKINPSLLASILYFYPSYYKNIKNNNPLPLSELNSINKNLIAYIISCNKKYFSKKDIYNIIENDPIDYNSMLQVISKLSTDIETNLFNRNIFNILSKKYNIPINQIKLDSIEYEPLFYK